MVADEQCRGGQELDVAATDQTSAKEKNRGRENHGSGRESVEGGARVAVHDHAQEAERADPERNLVGNEARPHIAIGGDGEQTAPENQDHRLHRRIPLSQGRTRELRRPLRADAAMPRPSPRSRKLRVLGVPASECEAM